jgi:hypothetical protein
VPFASRLLTLRGLARSRTALELEILALRHPHTPTSRGKGSAEVGPVELGPNACGWRWLSSRDTFSAWDRCVRALNRYRSYSLITSSTSRAEVPPPASEARRSNSWTLRLHGQTTSHFCRPMERHSTQLSCGDDSPASTQAIAPAGVHTRHPGATWPGPTQTWPGPTQLSPTGQSRHNCWIDSPGGSAQRSHCSTS